MRRLRRSVEQLEIFRHQMGAALSQEKALSIWGEDAISKLIEVESAIFSPWEPTPHSLRKLQYAKDKVSAFILRGVVRYIGVSGSVAAENAGKNDDIDLFVVVRNHTMWVYRFLVKLFQKDKVVWYGDKKQNDMFCLNYICEERGIKQLHEDIFIFHELYYLKSIYNPDYYPVILGINSWCCDKFGAQNISTEIEPSIKGTFVSAILAPLNYFLFIVQLTYMYVKGHSPAIGRVVNGAKGGRMEYFPEKFREEKLIAWAESIKENIVK